MVINGSLIAVVFIIVSIFTFYVGRQTVKADINENHKQICNNEVLINEVKADVSDVKVEFK